MKCVMVKKSNGFFVFSGGVCNYEENVGHGIGLCDGTGSGGFCRCSRVTANLSCWRM